MDPAVDACLKANILDFGAKAEQFEFLTARLRQKPCKTAGYRRETSPLTFDNTEGFALYVNA